MRCARFAKTVASFLFVRRLRPRAALIASCTLCLLAAIELGSCRPFFAREVSGKILSIEGEAHATIGGKNISLAKDSWIHPGETIVSTGPGRVDLMLLPGTLVELSGESAIEITRLRFAKDGNETIHPMTAREATIRLRHGTLFASVRRTQTRSRLIVQTAQGALSAGSGRTFKIEANGKSTRVMSIRGIVVFEPADHGAGEKIAAGYFAAWPANGATVPRSAASSGPEMQAEVTMILTARERLFHYEKRSRSEFIRRR